MDGEQLGLPLEAQLLAQHPAVRAHGKGIPTEDLASFIESLSDFARSRVTGQGAREYRDAAGQAFERKTREETLQDFTEEIADAINYLAILLIKVLAGREESQ